MNPGVYLRETIKDSYVPKVFAMPKLHCMKIDFFSRD